MSKVPGKVDFTQPKHGMGATSSKKNPAKVGFKQSMPAAGKSSAKKNPGKLPFQQKTAAMTGSSAKKNPGKVGFEQKKHGGSAAMPMASKTQKVNPPLTKFKKPQKVNPPAKVGGFKSVAEVEAFRKGKYGA